MADDTRVTLSRPGLACAFVLLWALCCGLPASASAAELIVRRDPGLSAGQRADLRADAGVKFERMLALPNAELVTVPAERVPDALAAMNANPDVRYAEPVAHFSVATEEPNDPWFSRQWALDNTGQLSGTPDADMDVPEAWDITRGAGTTVAVVDTGVDLDHPDLVDQIAPGGRSFVDGTTSADDDSDVSHGTKVAGVIAATADNGQGIAGVAPRASILPLKALDANGDGTAKAIGDALEYAASRGVRIVNLSFGGPKDSQYLRDVMASHPETLYVVPAGNGEYADEKVGDNVDAPANGLDDSGPEFPCNFPAVNIVCVGATNKSDVVWDQSNFGAISVDLFAPGLSIWTTRAPDPTHPPYAYDSGTSFAAPMVAAEAALVLAARPNLTLASLRKVVLSAVDPIESAQGRSVTGGRANAFAALTDPLPDTDDDGQLDAIDNCPTRANTDQADADGDGTGDVCDATPAGDDSDGDGVGLLNDRCPSVPGAAPDGCPVVEPPPSDGGSQLLSPVRTIFAPTPTPTPPLRIVSVTAKVTPRRCTAGKTCRRAATLTVKLTRTATVALKVERRVGKTWKRVAVRSIVATASGKSLTVRGTRGRSLSKGRYRVTATVAGARGACTFKV